MNAADQTLKDIARQVLSHAKAGSMELADEVMRLPASHYYDPVRFEQEVARVIKRVPLILGPSAEIPQPGDYKTLRVADTSIVVTRDAAGKANAFINACSHRGARLVWEEAGRRSRFTCPYHGWSFSNTGELLAVAAEDDFGQINKCDHGLIRLPVYERAGLIWGTLNPDSKLDMPAFLCGYDELLNAFGFDDWVFVSKRTFKGPNWKLAYDGYLEYYHVPVLHKDTFGRDSTKRGLYFHWGPHQHIKSTDTTPGHVATETLGYMTDLLDQPEADWDPEVLTYGVWTVFPTTSIASFGVCGRGVMISQILPGEHVNESITTQYFIMAEPPADPEAAEATFDFFKEVVMQEDYAMGHSAGETLKGSGVKHILFGRNELGNQHFHRWIDAFLEAEDDAAMMTLLKASMTVG